MTGLEDLEAHSARYQIYCTSMRMKRAGSPSPERCLKSQWQRFERPCPSTKAAIGCGLVLSGLMRVVVKVATWTRDGAHEQRVMISGIFPVPGRLQQRPHIARDPALWHRPGTRAVLEQSSRWGRIKAEVFCAMKSKYAMALYEMLELRRNMDRCIEVFPIERFRELMGVKPEAYRIGFDFHRSVVEPALLEVNGLSDMGVRSDCTASTPGHLSCGDNVHGGENRRRRWPLPCVSAHGRNWVA